MGEAEEGVRLRVRSGWARLSSSWLALGRARVSCRLASGLRPHGRRRLGVRVAVWRGCSSVQLGRWAQMFFRVVDRGPRHLGLGREEIANGVHCAASPTAL